MAFIARRWCRASVTGRAETAEKSSLGPVLGLWGLGAEEAGGGIGKRLDGHGRGVNLVGSDRDHETVVAADIVCGKDRGRRGGTAVKPEIRRSCLQTFGLYETPTGVVFEIVDAAVAARRHKPHYEETNP